MLVKKEVGMRKKKVLVMGTSLLLLIVIVAIGFLYFRGNTKKEKISYQTFDAITSSDIKVFGNKNQFVAITKGWSAGKQYTISQEGRIVDKEDGKDVLSHSQRKGEYWNVIIFDLDKEGYPSKKVNLYQAVKTYNASYFPTRSNHLIHYQGMDYLIVTIRPKNEANSNRDKKVFLNLQSHEVSDIPEEYKRLNPTDHWADLANPTLSRDVNDTTLTSIARRNGYLLLDYLVKDNSEKNTSKKGYDINLIKDHPQIKEIISKGGTVYPRQSMVSSEEWFNQMLHWLAPVGEKSLTVYPVDKPYADNAQPLTEYPIKSYQDYIAWKENQKKE